MPCPQGTAQRCLDHVEKTHHPHLCLFVCLGGFFGRGVWDLPQQGIKPVPPAWVAQSLRRWTAKEVLPMFLKGGFPQLASTTSSLSHLRPVALLCPTSS